MLHCALHYIRPLKNTSLVCLHIYGYTSLNWHVRGKERKEAHNMVLCIRVQAVHSFCSQCNSISVSFLGIL